MQITNLTKTKVDGQLLQKAARAAFIILGEINVSLVLVDDKKIREINKKYRGKDEVTDVLSFEDLNEIYICLPQAKRQTKINPPTPLSKGGDGGLKKLLKTGLETELIRLLVHGIVHLKGYDHERSKSAELEMQKIEEKILNS